MTDHHQKTDEERAAEIDKILEDAGVVEDNETHEVTVTVAPLVRERAKES